MMNMRDLVSLIESRTDRLHLWATVSKDVAHQVIEHGLKCLAREDGPHGRGCKLSDEPPPAGGADLDDLMVVLEFRLDADARILDLDDPDDAEMWQEGHFDSLNGKPAFVRMLRSEGIAGVRHGEQTWVFLRSALSFERVYDGIVAEGILHQGRENLDEVALGGLKRCTAVTLTALMAHYSKPGITLNEVPETGPELLAVLLKHGLAYKPEMTAKGKTVQQFVAQHSMGSYYIVTPGHAMALVDGELFDAENKGPDGRKLEGAMQVTRR